MNSEQSYGWMPAAAAVVVALTLRFSRPLLLIVLVCPAAMLVMIRECTTMPVTRATGTVNTGCSVPAIERRGPHDRY